MKKTHIIALVLSVCILCFCACGDSAKTNITAGNSGNSKDVTVTRGTESNDANSQSDTTGAQSGDTVQSDTANGTGETQQEEAKHYYREIRVTTDEKSHGFGDCFTHVNKLTAYIISFSLPNGTMATFAADDGGYDDYYQFLYNTETGYVESIKLFITYTNNKDHGYDPEDESTLEYMTALKSALLAETDSYNVMDVEYVPSEYQLIITFGTDRVRSFEQFISHLLSEKQDLDDFVKDVSSDLDKHPDMVPEEGANYIYELTCAECDGVRIEWYD